MLLTFSFKNFGPFKDECLFDMRAVEAYKEHPSHLIELARNKHALKVAVVYGANASGKSQFIQAYRCFARMALLSFQRTQPLLRPADSELRMPSMCARLYRPYMLDEGEGDIELEALFEAEDGQYQYGFCFNDREIAQEWLYFYKSGTERRTPTTILERSGPAPTDVSLGSTVRVECQKYLENLAPDCLALSYFEHLKLNNSVFQRTMQQILSVQPNINAMDMHQHRYVSRHLFGDVDDEELREGLLSMLRKIDISIHGFEVERHGEDDDYQRVFTMHRGIDGREYRLPIELESDGTQKIIALYGSIQRAIDSGQCLMVDELDADLHPLLLKMIVNHFHKQDGKAQLIFTAHDVSLLNRRTLRRDQVWFTDREEGDYSSLHSLSEYRVRKDAAYDSAYLGGVFGAIPELAEDW